MSRVLVVGGRGFYGRKVVEAIERLDVEVVAGSRRDGVDLAAPGEAFDGYEVVVNAADAVNAPPDGVMERVLERGGCFVCLSADPVGVERCLGLTRQGPGSVVIGAGVFPGLSTSMAAELAATKPRELELAIRINPLSGAGPGNVALMMRTLELPAWQGAAIGPASRTPFVRGEGSARVVRLGDAPLIERLAPQARPLTRLSVTPDFLHIQFASLGWVFDHAGPLRRPLMAMTGWSMDLLRGRLLRSVESPVEITASTEAARLMAGVADGQLAMAVAAAATVERVLRDPLEPGVHLAGELLSVAEMVERMGALGVEVELRRGAP